MSEKRVLLEQFRLKGSGNKYAYAYEHYCSGHLFHEFQAQTVCHVKSRISVTLLFRYQIHTASSMACIMDYTKPQTV